MSLTTTEPESLANQPSPAATSRVGLVMETVRGRMATRSLAPGARLPSIRQMAAGLGVSKSTVVEAYDRLVAEGEISARAGSGYFVSARTRPLLLEPARPATAPEVDPLWIMRQSLEPTPGRLMPGCGWLPEDWMPEEAMQKALRTVARAPHNRMNYDEPAGLLALRQQLTLRLADRGIGAEPGNLILTDSSTQAIDLICRFLLQSGDCVMLDDPCYFNFQAILRAHRVPVIAVPYTPTGPDLEAFARLAAQHRPRLYITNSALHNPTGASLAPTTAFRLLKLAEAHDITVIEDDIFADFEPEHGARLAAFDGLERVIHIGSFSKTLTAAARCGYIAAKADWVEGLIALKLATSFSNNALSAQLVLAMLLDGSYRRHVEGLRSRLADARGMTARRLAKLGLSLWTEPRGGMFLWARLPDGLSGEAVAGKALEEGIVLAPGSVFSPSGSAGSYLRFNAAQCSPPKIFEVLRRACQAAARAAPPA